MLHLRNAKYKYRHNLIFNTTLVATVLFAFNIYTFTHLHTHESWSGPNLLVLEYVFNETLDSSVVDGSCWDMKFLLFRINFIFVSCYSGVCMHGFLGVFCLWLKNFYLFFERIRILLLRHCLLIFTFTLSFT